MQVIVIIAQDTTNNAITYFFTQAYVKGGMRNGMNVSHSTCIISTIHVKFTMYTLMKAARSTNLLLGCDNRGSDVGDIDLPCVLWVFLDVYSLSGAR